MDRPTRLIRIGTHDIDPREQEPGYSNSNFKVSFRNNRTELRAYGVSVEHVAFPHTWPNVKADSPFVFRPFNNTYYTTKLAVDFMDGMLWTFFGTPLNSGFPFVYTFQTGLSKSVDLFVAEFTVTFPVVYNGNTGSSGDDVKLTADLFGRLTITSKYPFSVAYAPGYNLDTVERLLGVPPEQQGVQLDGFTQQFANTASIVYPGEGWYTDTQLAARLSQLIAADPAYITAGGTAAVFTQENLPQDLRWTLTTIGLIGHFQIYEAGNFAAHRLGFYQETDTVSPPGQVAALYLPSLTGVQNVYLHSRYSCNGVTAYDSSEQAASGTAKIPMVNAIPITAPYLGLQTKSWDFNGFPQISFMNELRGAANGPSYNMVEIDQVDVSLFDESGNRLDLQPGQHLSVVLRVFLQPL